MDLPTTLLLVVVAILGLNHMVLRIPGWHQRRVVFWALQLLNLVAAVLLMAVGIPGFAGATKAINWVLGLLLILHIVTNNGRLVQAHRDEMEDEETVAKRAAMLAALQRGEE